MKQLLLIGKVGLTLMLVAVTVSGCSAGSKKQEAPQQVVQVQDNPIPGTVTEDWEEPMYDQVKIPGQLDPTGIYYRNPHNTVVEIRSERYQEVQFPNDQPARKK